MAETAQGANPIVLEMYANGLSVSLTNADVGILFMVNNAAVAKINLSFTTAKSLKKILEEMIGKLEVVTERTIMTSDDVEAGLRKLVETETAATNAPK